MEKKRFVKWSVPSSAASQSSLPQTLVGPLGPVEKRTYKLGVSSLIYFTEGSGHVSILFSQRLAGRGFG